MLLARPGYKQGTHIETVCDKDGHIANIWRAMQWYPDELAKVCDWPVNHADLAARRTALIRREDELLARLIDDEKYCDVELAGYWIWATSQWIGAGMLDRKKVKAPGAEPELGGGNNIPQVASTGAGVNALGLAADTPQPSSSDKMPQVCGSGAGVHALGQADAQDADPGKRPSVGHGGHGVCAQGVADAADTPATDGIPYLTSRGKGIHSMATIPGMDEPDAGARPAVSHSGNGVCASGLAGEKRPHLSGAGMGVHGAQTHPDEPAVDGIPKISRPGDGVCSLGSIPHVGGSGEGIHALGPAVGNGGDASLLQVPFSTNLYAWFRALSERLRYVRVVCGDWKRVCGGNWQDGQGSCGMFFDPPYGTDATRCVVYKEDSMDVAGEVRQWALERGHKETYRMVLAGYYEEHEDLLKHGWRVHCWSAQGGYGNQGSEESRGKKNRMREALFFSPHCRNTALDLFAMVEDE